MKRVIFGVITTVVSCCVLITSCDENQNRVDLGYGIIGDKSCNNSGGHYKLTYKDSLIAAAVYDRIETLDSVKSIMLPYIEDDQFHYAPIGYAIFDLKKKQYIYEESSEFPIDTIIPINRLNYEIHGRGRHFATLKLTDNGNENYDAEIVPHFSSVTISVYDFIRMGERLVAKPTEGCMKEMYVENAKAYRLLEHIFNMWGEELSRNNDVNFARAMYYFIIQEYGGDKNKAINELNTILEILECGNIQDVTLFTSIHRCISNMQLSWAYDDIMRQFPIYELEYISWHNMVEAIVYYMDYMYDNTDCYNCKRMEYESTIMNIITERIVNLDAEKEIFTASYYTCPQPDSLKTLSDIDSILGLYHNTKDIGYYHPLWNEIRPAIQEWVRSREIIASKLPLSKTQIYRRLNEKMIDKLYYLIRGLDCWEIRPAMDR